MHDDVSTMLERLNQVRGCDSVVDNQRDAVAVSDRRNTLDVKNADLWVSDGLGEEQLGVWLNCALPLIEVILIFDEGGGDSKLRKGVLEEVVGAAIKS